MLYQLCVTYSMHLYNYSDLFIYIACSIHFPIQLITSFPWNNRNLNRSRKQQQEHGHWRRVGYTDARECALVKGSRSSHGSWRGGERSGGSQGKGLDATASRHASSEPPRLPLPFFVCRLLLPQTQAVSGDTTSNIAQVQEPSLAFHHQHHQHSNILQLGQAMFDLDFEHQSIFDRLSPLPLYISFLLSCLCA